MSLETLFHQITSPDRPFYHYPTYWLLCWVSWVYALIQRVRAIGYERGIFPARRLPVPVISVGNLTLGGTGKTPTVMWLAETLKKMGHRPAILSRGYGGEAIEPVNVVSDGQSVLMDVKEAGDEPVLLANRLPGVPVLTGRRRYPAGLHAHQKFGVDVVILDDGYQHLALKRDLNLLLIDHQSPLGNGRVFPAGPLREPVQAARRADAVLVTRCRGALDALKVGDLLGLDRPVIKSAYLPDHFSDPDGTELKTMADFKGQPFAAFCGIAQPDDFFQALENAGIELVVKQAFPDHFDYEARFLDALVKEAREKGAVGFITTEKDSVKLQGYEFDLPLWVLKMKLKIVEGEDTLHRLLKEILA